jgi:hypothetical protein
MRRPIDAAAPFLIVSSVALSIFCFWQWRKGEKPWNLVHSAAFAILAMIPILPFYIRGPLGGALLALANVTSLKALRTLTREQQFVTIAVTGTGLLFLCSGIVYGVIYFTR